MKISFIKAAALSLLLFLVNASTTFGQGTVRSVPNWANPILRDASYNIVAPGTPLVPNSTYYITLQALAPFPYDSNGYNALNILYLQSADGLTPSSAPYALDTGTAFNWTNTFTVTTVGADDLPERIYIRYRGYTGENNPNPPFGGIYTPTTPIKQALLP